MKIFKKLFGKAKRTVNKVKSAFDVDGSWTGTPEKGDTPVQDVDDL